MKRSLDAFRATIRTYQRPTNRGHFLTMGNPVAVSRANKYERYVPTTNTKSCATRRDDGLPREKVKNPRERGQQSEKKSLSVKKRISGATERTRTFSLLNLIFSLGLVRVKHGIYISEDRSASKGRARRDAFTREENVGYPRRALRCLPCYTRTCRKELSKISNPTNLVGELPSRWCTPSVRISLQPAGNLFLLYVRRIYIRDSRRRR